MKKTLLFLSISLCAFSLIAQTHNINIPLKLKAVPIGSPGDSLLVIDKDGLVKYIKPKSAVASVNGQIGAVTITAAGLGAALDTNVIKTTGHQTKNGDLVLNGNFGAHHIAANVVETAGLTVIGSALNSTWNYTVNNSGDLNLGPVEGLSKFTLDLEGNTNISGALAVAGSVSSMPTPTLGSHLTNKNYVDSKTVTASGGLTKTGSDIKLGGVLTPGINIVEIPNSSALIVRGSASNSGGFGAQGGESLGPIAAMGAFGANGVFKSGITFTEVDAGIETPSGLGLRYRNKAFYANATELTVMPKEYIDAKTAAIPKLIMFTASGDGETGRFRVPHGLVSPTMVLITPNSKDATTIAFDPTYGVSAFAYIDGADIVIENIESANSGSGFKAGTNNLKWTILVK